MDSETLAILARIILDLNRAINRSPDAGPRSTAFRLIDARIIVERIYRNGNV